MQQRSINLRATAKFRWFISLLFKPLLYWLALLELCLHPILANERIFFLLERQMSPCFFESTPNLLCLETTCQKSMKMVTEQVSYQYRFNFKKSLFFYCSSHYYSCLSCVCINLDMDIIEEMLFDVFFAEHKQPWSQASTVYITGQ